MMESVPLLVTLTFLGSWFGFPGVAGGLIFCGMLCRALSQRTRLVRDYSGLRRVHTVLCWLGQLAVLAFSTHCLITAARLVNI
jgi:hypothetical protein